MAMYRAALVLAFGLLAACASSDTSAAPDGTTADPQDVALAEWCGAVTDSQAERAEARGELEAAIAEAERLGPDSDEFSAAARNNLDQLMSEMTEQVERRFQAERDIVRSATQLRTLTAPLAATAPDDVTGHFETLLDRYESLATVGPAGTEPDYFGTYRHARQEIAAAFNERCPS